MRAHMLNVAAALRRYIEDRVMPHWGAIFGLSLLRPASGYRNAVGIRNPDLLVVIGGA